MSILLYTHTCYNYNTLHYGSRRLCLLPGVHDLVVLAYPDLRLLLAHHVLDKHVLCIVRLELADPARIPQLARNTQVLAASHHRVGLAPFRGSRYAVWTEVVLLAAGYRYKPADVSITSKL